MGTTRLIRNNRWGPCLLVTSSGRGFRPPRELFTGYKISEWGTPSGIIHDSLSVGCNSVDNGCGYTYTGQQWVWCNGTTNTVDLPPKIRAQGYMIFGFCERREHGEEEV